MVTPEMTDLEWLSNPDNWPLWPWCAVKRDGVLGCVPSDAPEVHVFNIWDLRVRATTPIKKLVYESLAALCEAGWRVD